MTTVLDAAGEGSANACWALMRRATADKFESASSAAKPSPVQGVASCRPEKPDTYWSALRGTERPVISVVEIRYVRRSEIRLRGDRRNEGRTITLWSIGMPAHNLVVGGELQTVVTDDHHVGAHAQEAADRQNSVWLHVACQKEVVNFADRFVGIGIVEHAATDDLGRPIAGRHALHIDLGDL